MRSIRTCLVCGGSGCHRSPLVRRTSSLSTLFPAPHPSTERGAGPSAPPAPLWNQDYASCVRRQHMQPIRQGSALFAGQTVFKTSACSRAVSATNEFRTPSGAFVTAHFVCVCARIAHPETATAVAGRASSRYSIQGSTPVRRFAARRESHTERSISVFGTVLAQRTTASAALTCRVARRQKSVVHRRIEAFHNPSIG